MLLCALVSGAANVALTANDGGGTSSFNSAGHWSNGAAPNITNNYSTAAFTLRSPANTTSYTFAGGSLSIDSGGRFLMKGGGGQTMTASNLVLNGGVVDMANANSDNFIEILGGNITLNAGTTSFVGALSGSSAAETLVISAPISGSGNLQIAGPTVNAGVDNGAVIFSGTNSYTGSTLVAGGTLFVNAPLKNANVVVTNGGTLGGTGVITPRAGGRISILSNGMLAPGGTNLGAFTVDGSAAGGVVVALAGGGGLRFRLNAGFQSDMLRLTNAAANDVLFTNNNIDFTDLSGGSLANGDYTLFSSDAAGAYSGLTLDGSNYITSGLSIGSGLDTYPGARLRLSTNDIVLEVTTNQPFFITTLPLALTNNLGISLVVGSNGVYSVNFVSPVWTFTGNLAQDLTNRSIASGVDNIGAYSEITFNYASAVTHTASIRVYEDSPIVLFSDTTLADGLNDLAFPSWVNYPVTTSHVSFGADPFGQYSFSNFYDGSPWLYFNTNYDTFIISAATNFEVASPVKSGSQIAFGVNSAITQLPSGFRHRAVLVAQKGINKCYTTWGNALLALAGKKPPANDAAIELEKLSYWTDNGATYYYNTNAPLGIENTLLAINNEFSSKEVPIGSLQLDSWWYEKGSCACWQGSGGNRGGIYLYIPDPALFPDDLIGFRQQLGLPLITHARWIDPSSPYASQYTMSATVITDPRYWADRMAYLKSSGVTTYEQDWISSGGTPAMSLTNGGDAYLGNMQAAAAANGINLQYCMPRGRDYLQGTLYTNVMTIRTSFDAFNSSRWQEFIYDSRLAQAVGIWPWCDEFRSAETRNLLVATLSAGPVGTGDALGAVNAANLAKSVRPDGVIVKPDVPLAPTDSTYVNDALGLGKPFVSSTYTDHIDSRAAYIFAFAENSSNLSGSFKPSDFGISTDAYVYDFFNATGTVVSAGGPFNFTTTMPNNTTGGSYYVVVPIGPSGIAFLGDTTKFVTRGKKRVSNFSDAGQVLATISFATGETNVTLVGYAPSAPFLLSPAGNTNLTYNPNTHLFSFSATPGNSGSVTLTLSLHPAPPLKITTVQGGNIQIFWDSSAIGYVLQQATNLVPPVFWSQCAEPVSTNNGTNFVTVSNIAPTVFYRLSYP